MLTLNGIIIYTVFLEKGDKFNYNYFKIIVWSLYE